MCKPISAILLKDRVLFSNTSHSHSDILEQNNIRDAYIQPYFVKIELYPENGDMFSDPATWTYAPDQDTFPDWYVAEVDEPRMRAAAAGYIKDHIHIGKDGLVLSDGLHWVKDCTNVTLTGTANIQELRSSKVGTMRESSKVGTMWGSSKVGTMRESSEVGTMCGSSKVGTMRESSKVGTMWGSSEVGTMCGSSKVGTMCGSSKVGTMRESSEVGTMWESSEAFIPDDYYSKDVDVQKIILCENATIKDCRTKTIYQSGDWKLVIVEAKANA